MTGAVYIKTYDAPPYDTREVLRYAGAKNPTDEIVALMQECINEVGDRLTYKVCYAESLVEVCDEEINLTFAKTNSRDLKKNLKNCESVVLFAATVGLEIDRLIARYSRISPSKALMFQAVGTERIEALCNMFNKEIKERMHLHGKHTRPRFSPGYGDLPLELQQSIFKALDCPRKIGISLNESLLMSPTKSVTAIIGIARDNGEDK